MLHGGEALMDARTVPVQGIRPGDHAFAAYGGADVPAQWGMLGAFVRQGLIAGEKVLVVLAPEPRGGELLDRLDARTPAVERAWRRGQLQLTSMRTLIGPDRRFTARRQRWRLTEETRRAVDEGYPAVRAYFDMAWVADLDIGLDAVVRREREAGHLFADRSYSEVCAYDERAFPADVLEAVAEAHPRNLLGGPGVLRAQHGDGRQAPSAPSASSVPWVRMVGEADARTRRDFTRALQALLFRGATRSSGAVTVDLTSLHFLSGGCATWLLRLCADSSDVLAAGTRTLDGDTGVTLHCTRPQARLLHRLGAGSVDSLRLVVEGEHRC